jgi:hypothetical protein
MENITVTNKSKKNDLRKSNYSFNAVLYDIWTYFAFFTKIEADRDQ